MRRKVRNPVIETRKANERIAAGCLDSARYLYQEGAGNAEQTFCRLFQASLFDPKSEEIKAELREVMREHSFHIQPSLTPKIQSMEEDLTRNPDTAGYLMPLAQLHQGLAIIEIMVDKTENKHRFNARIISKTMKQLGFEPSVQKYNGKAARGFFVFLAEFLEVEDAEELGLDNSDPTF